MAQWHNPSGRPLSSTEWLIAHHRAKLAERKSFAESVLTLEPRRVVDLGCGPGCWLSVFNDLAKPDCELIGLDLDPTAVSICQRDAREWQRGSQFQEFDLDADISQIPEADVYLAFNTFSYLKRPMELMEVLQERTRNGAKTIVRQYDGGLFRFGPLEQRSRAEIDSSLWASTAYSHQFNHYDLNSLFTDISKANFRCRNIGFETFSRCSPYPLEFLPYFRNSLEWMMDNISEEAAKLLKDWYLPRLSRQAELPSYFTEVDLVAWLS